MNRKIEQANRQFCNTPLNMSSMAETQRNNKRTEINLRDVDPIRVMELADMLRGGDKNGLFAPIPWSEIKDDTPDTLNVVMQANGLYTFPTQELIDFLRQEIDDDPAYEPHTAIEICAGTGWIGRTLGIPITDSHMQERPDIRAAYIDQGSMPIIYPTDVEKLDALTAVRKYNPEYVIASYCTHLYGTGSLKSGNSFGVDTRWIVQHCHRFYHIGNDDIHSRDPIMQRPHKRLQFDWLVTRGNSAHARIYVWENKNY